MKHQPKISTIIYATDLGGHTRPVFQHAMAMAKHYGAKIIMIHVVEPVSETAMAVINAYLSKDITDKAKKETMDELLGIMKKRLQDFYEDSEEKDTLSSLVKEMIVVSGKPSEEILRVAEENNADMIVVGKSTRKVRGIRVMGSTSRRVSRVSTIPVLVIPNDE